MPPQQYQSQQAVQQLLQGMNTMQMRSGLMPGGMQQMPQLITPPQMGPRASDVSSALQVQFMQAQQLSQMVTPPAHVGGGITPVRRPSGFENAMMMPGVNLPGSQFGNGRGMARQRARSNTNEHYAQAQAGVSLGSRGVGTGGAALAGGMLGGMMMGPSGALMGAVGGATAFEHFGGGQKMQKFGANLMQPMINTREQALKLQNQSMGYVRSGSDMSQSGRGLSMEASTKLTSQLNRMSDSKEFKGATGGRFNKQDVMKITSLAGDMGMLDQASTADEIKTSISKISRSLSNFMKIAEEPDVQKAMKMLGNMRAMGMTTAQTSVATANARRFARMAGMSTTEVMEGGMQGAGMYQQRGMSAAAGMNTGMAAQGMAGQMAGNMDPRRLSMAGGQQGIASDLAQGAAQAGTVDALLPAMLTRRNGRLAIDREQIVRMATGEVNLQQAIREGAGNLDSRGIQELSTRRRELQDEAQDVMGGQMAALMPLIHARAAADSVPGMTIGAALRGVGNMSERQARTYEQMIQSPEFWNGLREQNRASLREDRSDLARRRENTENEAAATRPARLRQHSMDDMVQRGRTAVERVEGFVARRQDRAEEREAQGGGDLISTVDASRTDTEIQRAAARDLSRTSEGRTRVRQGIKAARAQVDEGVEEEQDTDSNINQLRRAGVGGAILATVGERIVEGYRGQQSERQLVDRNQGFATRVMRTYGGSVPSTERIRAEGDAMRRVGQSFERINTQTYEQRDAGRQAARSAVGKTVENDRDFDRMTGLAASAINAHADDATTFGITHGEFTEESQQAAVREQLSAAGYSAEQINEAVNSPEFMTQARSSGAHSRTAAAQTTIDGAVETGAAVEAARTGQRDRISREQADQIRSDALDTVGLSDGMFSSTSEEQQRAVLDAMSGEGPDGDLRRKLMAVRALEERGKATGDRELLKRADVMRSRLEASESAEDMAMAAAGISGVETTTLARIGENVEDQNDADILEGFEGLGADLIQAQTSAISNQVEENLGVEGARILKEGGEAALRTYLENDGGDMRSEERDRMIRGLRSGNITEDSINTRAAREVTNATESTFAGGLSQLADADNMADVFSALQTAAGAGQETFSDEVSAQGGPQTFEQAVGTFSEASDKLLRAAGALGSSGALSTIGQVAAAGSPLGAVGLAATSLPLSIANMLFGDD